MSAPQFLVEIPPHRRAEREYALAVLLGDWLGVTYTVRVVDGLATTRLRLGDGSSDDVIVMPDRLLSATTVWLSEESLPASMPAVAAPDWTGMDGTLPLLFPVDDSAPELIRRDGHVLSLGFDLLGSLFFMLTRYEEYVRADQRDAHDRFRAQDSIAGRCNWLQWPILDMYLHAFVGVLKLAWPRVDVDPIGSERVLLSHDVDHPASPMLWHGRQRFRTMGGDMARRRNLGLALWRASSFASRSGALSRLDPFNTFDFLMTTSEAAGIRSTFFFLAMNSELPHGTAYRLEDKWATCLIRQIADRGHAIGLHGSYDSYLDPSKMAAEWAVLADACRGLPDGTLRRAVRQHYLRWRAGATWPAQEEAGLLVDETLGYADAIGYRAGTARSFTAYDLTLGRPLAVRVRPLHIMDVTVVNHYAQDKDGAIALMSEMAKRTRRFGGALSILWHNSSLETRSAKRYYLQLLRSLAVMPHG